MKYLRSFETEANYSAYTQSQEYVTPNVCLIKDEQTVVMNKYEVPTPPVHDYSQDYFTIVSASDNNEIGWKAYSSSFTKTINISTDGGQTWTQKTSSNSGTTLTTLNTGDKLLIKGNNTAYAASNSFYYNYFTSTVNFNIEGNIMSLIYGDNFIGQTTLSETYTFYRLFINSNVVDASNLILPATTLVGSCYSGMFTSCNSLTTAPALPATTLADYCYSGMFFGCNSLTTAPALPATTLANNCYQEMFNSCYSLATAPELPATTLANYCYSTMFIECTSLATAPVLPATTLADYCYDSMFRGCNSLTTAPALPATTLANYCYQYMFYGCTSLTTAPALPATTLANYCYQYMFYGCTSLTTAPVILATTLTNYCYYYMFYGCTSLTTAPDLPATTLTQYCYAYMFHDCTSLTTAPVLPATTLAENCYFYMFRGCTSLNYIKCLATNISAERCTLRWVQNVAVSGTFVKDPSMTSWTTTGYNGIPSGWTIEDYTE